MPCARRFMMLSSISQDLPSGAGQGLIDPASEAI